MKKILILLLLAFSAMPLAARKFEVPADYSFKGQYEAYEKDIVKAIKWLAKTTPDKDVEKRKEAKSFLSKWIMGCPYITVALNAETLNMPRVSGDLYAVYLGGSILHSIKKKNSDPAGSTYRGIKAAVKYYRKHKDVIGEKEMFENYLKLQKEGKLKKYLTKQE